MVVVKRQSGNTVVNSEGFGMWVSHCPHAATGGAVSPSDYHGIVSYLVRQPDCVCRSLRNAGIPDSSFSCLAGGRTGRGGGDQEAAKGEAWS